MIKVQRLYYDDDDGGGSWWWLVDHDHVVLVRIILKKVGAQASKSPSTCSFFFKLHCGWVGERERERERDWHGY